MYKCRVPVTRTNVGLSTEWRNSDGIFVKCRAVI